MAHSTIKRGSKGSDVREAQQELIARGYDVGPAGTDGIFGMYTYRAVLRYQLDRSEGQYWALTLPLEVDGIVGPHTWSRLSPATIRRGDSGEGVRLVQKILSQSSYEPWDPGKVDGDFGTHTEQAVRNFQADLGLTVDGIVGRQTWRACWS